jgi:hypothetical protein
LRESCKLKYVGIFRPFATLGRFQVDRYTKTVLTVIALALSIIALRDMGVLPATAQSEQLTRVEVCGQNAINGEPQCAKIWGNALLTKDR